jgi:hypothetical protein
MIMLNVNFSIRRMLLIGGVYACSHCECIGQNIGDIIRLEDHSGSQTTLGIYCGEYRGKSAVIGYQDIDLNLFELQYAIIGGNDWNLPTPELLQYVNNQMNHLTNINGFDGLSNQIYFCRESDSDKVVGFKTPDKTLNDLNYYAGFTNFHTRRVHYYNTVYLAHYAQLSTQEEDNRRIIVLPSDDEDINSVSTDFTEINESPIPIGEFDVYPETYNQTGYLHAPTHYSYGNFYQEEYNPHLYNNFHIEEPCDASPDTSNTQNLNNSARLLSMYDSYGDGWNGGTFEILDASEMRVAYGGLESGHQNSEELLLDEGCYAITVQGGAYPEEISWHLQLTQSININSSVSGTVGRKHFGIGALDCDPIMTEINTCASQEVANCDGSQKCFPQSWLGDGYCDGPDQEYDADLSCYNNDEGDCGTLDCQGKDYNGYEDWIGDGYCDDGTWGFYFNCPMFNDDEGDCLDGLRRASNTTKSSVEAELNLMVDVLMLHDQVNYNEKGPLNYRLYDILGGLVCEGRWKESEKKLLLDNVIPGVYILRVHTRDEVEIQKSKFIKH